ncbi:hypothetical protein QQ994_21890 [Pseudomonas asiatica]|uniref:hypothetical protein n=1 Tax=Pseudomonas asiatica TaxID=2219225 RepID=UPI002570ECD5|nr:hypothetical protein [Pseudomonas asiatica]WJD73068.1 hypothetical protein QQ994_21890 [Pseudomonas asiatica]
MQFDGAQLHGADQGLNAIDYHACFAGFPLANSRNVHVAFTQTVFITYVDHGILRVFGWRFPLA